jgi:hypothetical protein
LKKSGLALVKGEERETLHFILIEVIGKKRLTMIEDMAICLLRRINVQWECHLSHVQTDYLVQ